MADAPDARTIAAVRAGCAAAYQNEINCTYPECECDCDPVSIPSAIRAALAAADAHYLRQEPADDLVWAMCRYVRRGLNDVAPIKCDQCPKWQTHDGEPYMRGCYLQALEAVNIGQTGTAWRKPRSDR